MIPHVLAALPFLFAAPVAAAPDGDGPVVVLSSLERSFPAESWPDAERRVAAELRLLGFRVVRVDARAAALADRMEEMARLADAYQALAVLWVARSGREGAATIWLNDALTGKVVTREIRAEDLRRPDAAGLLALRVVELLEASLVEVRLGRPLPGATPVPAVVERLVAESLDEPSRRWRVRPGAAASVSFDGLTAVGPTLGAGYRLLSVLALEGDVVGAVPIGSVTDARGSASVGWLTFRLQLVVEPWPGAAVSPGIGAGIGGLALWASGAAAAGYTGTIDAAAVALPSVYARLAVRLVEDLALVAAVSLGFPVPAIDIRFAGETVASTGPLLLEAGLALEWAL